MRTVKVRVAVVVNELGEYSADGCGLSESDRASDEDSIQGAYAGMYGDQGDCHRHYFLTAELEVPELAGGEVAATVEEAP